MSESSSVCGCFHEGPTTPRDVVKNESGRSSLDYRIGTYASFRNAILADIFRPARDVDKKALERFTSRDGDDPTIALIGAFSAGLDVLTFYQERIANEAYLRTATERQSVGWLASTIGYTLNPGVAATTYLAFTVDEAVGAPKEVRLSVGTKVQSQPGQDEIPQTFETIEEITARLDLNAIKLQTREFLLPKMGDKSLTLEGTSSRLVIGDSILIVGREREGNEGSERWDVRRLTSVTEDAVNNATVVTWDEGLGYRGPSKRIDPAAKDVEVFCFRKRANLFGYNAPSWKTMMEIAAATSGGSSLSTQPAKSEDSKEAKETKEWPGFNIAYEDPIPEELDSICLDQSYPSIVPNSWVLLTKPGHSEVFRVEGAVEDGLSFFGISGRSTRLELSGENLREEFRDSLRETVVLGESEELAIASNILSSPVSGRTFTLDSLVTNLSKGQVIGISGVLEVTNERYTGIATITDIFFRNELTVLEIDIALPSLIRSEVRINGNVAKATHGETKEERIGSGNAALRFQRFKLSQTPRAPLTYVASSAPSGASSSLEIKVEGVTWREVDSLYDAEPTSRAYTVRVADDGTAYVAFGDGVRGARPPSGTGNIKAKYRVGLGLDGLLDAGQLSLLQSKPLGLKSVTNPAAPEGAADPEPIEDARSNAPLTVLTLDRVVSLQDHEDFARSFAGLTKARADLVWGARDRELFVTVMGETADANLSSVIERLVTAIGEARHPGRPISVDVGKVLNFRVEARVLHDPLQDGEAIRAAATLTLQDLFGFSKATLAMPLSRSDVTAALQATPGVVAANVDFLYIEGSARKREEHLNAKPASWNGGTIQPAQLLVTDASRILIQELMP